MFLYEGISCPVCDQALSPDDDIVVCPDCGAPHHRTCWFERGVCAFHEKHGTEEQWKRPQRAEPSARGTTRATARCPHCNTINAADTEKCNDCGRPMQPDEHDEHTYAAQGEGVDLFASVHARYRVEKESGTPEDCFEDVGVGDVAAFVGTNKQYYLPKFRMLHKLRSSGGFNFAALLFPGLWLLYRKMYKLGIVFTALVYGLELAYSFIYLQWLSPFIDAIYSRAGIDMNALDSGAFLRLYDEMMKMEMSELWLILLPGLIPIIILGISIYAGATANRRYYRHCLERTRQIRSEHPDPNGFETELTRQGNVNLPIVLSIGFGYYLISRLLLNLL